MHRSRFGFSAPLGARVRRTSTGEIVTLIRKRYMGDSTDVVRHGPDKVLATVRTDAGEELDIIADCLEEIRN